MATEPASGPSFKPPSQSSVSMKSDVSPYIRKLRAAPEGYGFEPKIRPEPTDPFSPPCGLYFFYGTLTDPHLLRRILSLSETPYLRPARVVGYTLKRWSGYPALVDGSPGEVVEGVVYNVKEKTDAEKLAQYETRAYWPTPCRIFFTDLAQPQEASGSTFKLVGRWEDIHDEASDVQNWNIGAGRVKGSKSST